MKWVGSLSEVSSVKKRKKAAPSPLKHTQKDTLMILHAAGVDPYKRGFKGE